MQAKPCKPRRAVHSAALHWSSCNPIRCVPLTRRCRTSHSQPVVKAQQTTLCPESPPSLSKLAWRRLFAVPCPKCGESSCASKAPQMAWYHSICAVLYNDVYEPDETINEGAYPPHLWQIWRNALSSTVGLHEVIVLAVRERLSLSL